MKFLAPSAPRYTAGKWWPHGRIDVDTGVRRTLEMVVAAVIDR
jgi:hypothetical protein